MFNEEELEAEVVSLCKKLIKIPSNSGSEESLVSELRYILEGLDFDEITIDKYGSIIAKAAGKKKGPKILFDVHIDTVPVEDEKKWSVNPYEGIVNDNRIYGRGTSDMKGALSAVIIAVSEFLKQTDRNFDGEIYVSGTVHEECFEGMAASNISKVVEPDYVVICEASELNLKIGQRGRAEIIVETFGQSAHSSNPKNGLNAVYIMCEIIEKIRDLPTSSHELLGDGILELTDIKSSPYPGASVVPDYCKATFDRRVIVGEDKEEVLAPIKEVINKNNNGKVSLAYGKEKCYTGEVIEGERFFPAWLMDPENIFVKNVYQGLKSIGLTPKITTYSFCTNGSHYAAQKKIPTVGFGPSKELLAHIVDEYIEINDLVNSCKGYYGIMKKILLNN